MFVAIRKMYNWWRQRKHKKQTKDETHLHMSWEQDYHLQDPGRLALFDEYLEMGIHLSLEIFLSMVLKMY